MIRNTQSVENIEENHRFLPFFLNHDQGIEFFNAAHIDDFFKK